VADQSHRSVAISGSNGYVGSILADAFTAAGWQVIALQRRPSAYSQIGYELTSGPSQPLPEGVDCVVHCAFAFGAYSANVVGTRQLLAAADRAAAKSFVLISSMSAYDGTAQAYGRAKLECEALVTGYGGTSLRLGLVHGRTNDAMIGALRRVAGLPFVPVLAPDSHQFLAHADDVARCVVDIAEHRPERLRVLGVAHPQPVLFSDLMRELHAAVSSRPFRALPVPVALVDRALMIKEAIGLNGGFRRDSLAGLTKPAPNVPNVDYWASRGVEFQAALAAQPERELVAR